MIMRYICEWDDEKAASNLRKHGVSFETAAEVFQDDNRIECYDAEHSTTEDRYITIGRVNAVLFVVYTERGRNIRLISARMATAKERRIYYGHSLL